MHAALSYLFQLGVNTTEAFKEVDDLHIEPKLLLWVLWVAAGKHGTKNGGRRDSECLEASSLASARPR